MITEEYRRYLRSDEWKEKRKEFLESENYECEECGNKATQVHHKSYENIYNEEREDVEVLCRDCHIEKEEEKGTDLYYTDFGEYGS